MSNLAAVWAVLAAAAVIWWWLESARAAALTAAIGLAILLLARTAEAIVESLE